MTKVITTIRINSIMTFRYYYDLFAKILAFFLSPWKYLKPTNS